MDEYLQGCDVASHLLSAPGMHALRVEKIKQDSQVHLQIEKRGKQMSRHFYAVSTRQEISVKQMLQCRADELAGSVVGLAQWSSQRTWHRQSASVACAESRQTGTRT